MFSSNRNKGPLVMDKSVLTRPDSPKVVRERKSRDVNPSQYRSPRAQRREKDDGNLQKVIYDLNTCCWSLKYQVENPEYAKGAYGKILLATDKVTGEKVVIKKIPQTTPIKMITNEVRAGKILGCHPNIAALLQYIDKPDFHFLVFQFVQAQDMFVYLENLRFVPRPDVEARSIVTQILRGLKHIHACNIAHRDIKLENLLIDANGKVTIIDMGLCAFIEEGKPLRDWCGSDNYLAPEICRRIPYNGYQADIFSVGVVLFALLFGVFPFENLRVSTPMDPKRRIKVRFPADVKVDLSAQDLLSKMLDEDPDKRIQLKDIFKHPWIESKEERVHDLRFQSSECAPTTAP